jgi:hypothetical protein
MSWNIKEIIETVFVHPDHMVRLLPVAVYFTLVRASGFIIFPTTDRLYQAAILNTWGTLHKNCLLQR